MKAHTHTTHTRVYSSSLIKLDVSVRYISLQNSTECVDFILNWFKHCSMDSKMGGGGGGGKVGVFKL